MKLGELIFGLEIHSRGGVDPSLRICDITEDSRTAMPGSLFIARTGEKHDGRAHIPAAVAAGAVAVLVEPAASPIDTCGAALLETPNLPRAMACLAERFFGDPTGRLRLLGVTGTNGKTTIAHLIHQLLNRAGVRCGLIGTVEIDNGVETVPAWMTTPSALELSRYFSLMLDSGCAAAVMEVSSHALHQARVAGLRFDIGLFTNLTGDHLDYHGSMEAYAQAKALLFESLPMDGVAIVNADDPAATQMLSACAAHRLICTMTGAGAALRRGEGDHLCEAIGRAVGLTHTDLTLRGPWGEVSVQAPLVGAHNVMNALQACAAAWTCGLTAVQIAHGLDRIAAPPGRLQRVESLKQGANTAEFAVFVDYAHTDDALRKAIDALRPLVPPGGRLRTVFGCGGDRDRTKRPRMGKVAAELSDEIIITSDNPRTEDPESIVAQIRSGVPLTGAASVRTEVDRELAICFAIDTARPGDVILIAGKGHEDYQILPDGSGGTMRRHFDDREVARTALEQRSSAAERIGAA